MLILSSNINNRFNIITMKKLKTDVLIKYNKKGNIKKLVSPYDKTIVMKPIKQQ